MNLLLLRLVSWTIGMIESFFVTLNTGQKAAMIPTTSTSRLQITLSITSSTNLRRRSLYKDIFSWVYLTELQHYTHFSRRWTTSRTIE